jgi:RND family efflux transporter, MFP subunit
MKARITQMVTAHKKMLIIIASGIVLGAAILTTVLLYMNQHKNAAGQATYREYTVEKGDVTVGTSESGTVSLDEETVTFPIDVSIDKVLVKAGYSVKTGDALVKLNQTSITSGTLETKTNLAEAKTALEQALADQDTKLKAAKLTYQTSLQKAADAYTQESLSKDEIQNNVSTAQSTLNDAKTQLSKYQALQSGFTADYNKLDQLKKWRDDSKTQETSFETQLTNYNDEYSKQLGALSSLKSDMNSKYTAWETAKLLDNESGEEAEYDDAKDAYNAYADQISSIVSGQDDLESKVAQYTAEYNNYSSAYDDFNETFTSKYGSTSTADALADKVTSLQSQVKDAQYALTKAQKSQTGDLDTAEQTLQSSLDEGGSAQTTYNLAVEQLAEAATNQQTKYDSLKSELDDVNSAINGDGTLTAPCDGTIVAVNTTDGGSVDANQTIVTIAKNSSVSMSVSLSEDDITNVKIGQQAQVTLSAYEGQTFDAAVESIAASPARSGSASVSYTVTVKLTGEVPDEIFIGMSGEVTVIQKQQKNVLYVPDQAITFENGVSSVLVKKQDGTQEKTTVTTGFSNGRYVEVSSGLQEGETVLAESAVVR